MDEKTCGHCSGYMVKKDGYNGLFAWNKEPDGEVVIQGDKFFPVQVYFCKSCGHVELKFQDPSKV